MIYKVIWDNGADTCGSIDTPAIGQGKEECLDMLTEWRNETCCDWWGIRMPTEKEIEDYDYMIFNCEAYVSEFPDDYDEDSDPSDYVVWEMDEETSKMLFWDEWENIKDNYAEAINSVKKYEEAINSVKGE